MLSRSWRRLHWQSRGGLQLERRSGGDSTTSITPLRPSPPTAARHTWSNHVNLHTTSTGYRLRRAVIDDPSRLSTSFVRFATLHTASMAEPTNPTTPEQILADVPGKWEKAKESGELLFFPSTERIVPGDFPVSTAE